MYPKPNIVVSKCIEFDHCRYDGSIIRSDQVRELKSFVHFIPVCPEYEIHLGIPRDPIRLVKKDKTIELIQPSTGKTMTRDMNIFIDGFFNTLKDIDGFILKSRSPSCGLSDVKVYSSMEKGPAAGKSSGIFGGRVKQSYSNLAIEDEGRLRNPLIRDYFLKRIYTSASFREVKKKKKMSALIDFHARNKFLFMGYHQKNLELMGRIVANADHQDITKVLSDYDTILTKLFNKSPSCERNINVLQHIYGFFSDQVNEKEKKYYFETVELYQNGQISLATVLRILESWAVRFDQTYLLEQTFFNPYPKDLIHIENIDSCHARDYW